MPLKSRDCNSIKGSRRCYPRGSRTTRSDLTQRFDSRPAGASLSFKMEKKFDFLFKLLLIGDSGVGKTCIIFRFVENSFNPAFITTIGIDFKIRTVEIGKYKGLLN